MKIRPRIPKFAGGDALWYSKLTDYDPRKYESVYNPDYLFSGDTANGLLLAWKSDISGFDKGRYLPTNGHGAFGINKAHFNYTLGVERQPYYNEFGKALLDENGNFTSTGEAWAKAVDALLPKGSNASFYGPDGKLRTSWTTLYKDAHGRSAQTFNNLKDYVNHVRYDQVLGARHNVFGKTGRRYFYKDENGVEHWVDPSLIKDYTVSDSPVREVLDRTTMWEDYELKGLNNPSSQTPTETLDPNKKGNRTEVGGNPFENKNSQQQGESALDRLRGMLPGLLSTGRLAGNLINNQRVYDEALKGIRPTLIQPYYTHRQVVGDEATKLAYYRRAVQGLTKASRPFTSDADRQMAYMQEARRVGDELRALGDLADNQEIRRTSDESNQHLWANTQRATEVANTNLASLNDANEKKHTLLAQKHSAQWSSIDNYLKEIEYRKRLLMEEDNAFNKLIDLLSYLTLLESDPKLKEAQDALWKLAKYDSNNNPTWDSTDPAVKAALEKLKLEQARVAIQSLRYRRDINRKYSYSPFFIKSGSKITYKKKDDLLYKSAKDVVDHFRKMCRRYPEKERKIQPLAPHPDGTKRKKYLTGGLFLAPFTVYTPVVGGGETSRTISLDSSGTSSKASSSKDTTLKDMLDLIKMFKDIKGIKVDVSSIYANIASILLLAELFGKELSSQQMATMYLRAMLQLNNVSRSKEIYDKAYEQAAANGALNEIAVDSLGQYAVQNKETGEIEMVSKIDTSKYIPLTNSQLLTFREFKQDLAFNKGDEIMQNVVANGIGLPKIGQEIKALAGKLGSSELKLDGISEVESNMVKLGLKLLQGAPDGSYKTTTDTKNLLALKQSAIKYIINMLPRNYLAVLEAHGGAKNLIPTFLSSQMDDSLAVNFSSLTGKAASKDDKDSSEKIKSNPLTLMIQGEGGVPRTWNLITKDSNVKMSVDGIEYPQLPKITEDMSLDKMLSGSGIAGILDSKQGITFGDLNILPDLFKDIMYSNSGGMVVTLPCKIVNGHKEVNLGVKKTYEEAIQEVESKGLSKNSPEYYKILGEVLKQKGLNSLLDSNGYPDKSKFGQFLVVEAYTTDKIKNLDTSSLYIEKVKNPDAQLEERMIRALSTDSKKSNYSLDIDYWLYGDNVYRGSVFIPLTNNLNAANNSWGDLISIENAKELENKFQNFKNFNKASNMKSSNSDVL